MHQWRDIYGADLVALLVHHDDWWDYYGKGAVLQSLGAGAEDRGFSVMVWQSVESEDAIAHQTGHNLGCAHSPDDPDWEGLFEDSHAFCYQDGAHWSCTIMRERYSQYSDFDLYSNPDVKYGVLPVGNDQCNNAGTINISKYTVESFRPHLEWVDLDGETEFPFGHYHFPWNSLRGGLDHADPGDVVKMMGGSTTEAPLIDQSVVLDSYPGSALIGAE